jgi:hypothetical protein
VLNRPVALKVITGRLAADQPSGNFCGQSV